MRLLSAHQLRPLQAGDSLIVVIRAAPPDLQLVEIRPIPSGPVEALALVAENDSVITRPIPVLLSDVQALPDLHFGSVGCVRVGGIETEIGAGELDLGLTAAGIEDPVLSRGTVAVANLSDISKSGTVWCDVIAWAHLHGLTILASITQEVNALAFVPVWVQPHNPGRLSRLELGRVVLDDTGESEGYEAENVCDVHDYEVLLWMA